MMRVLPPVAPLWGGFLYNGKAKPYGSRCFAFLRPYLPYSPISCLTKHHIPMAISGHKTIVKQRRNTA